MTFPKTDQDLTAAEIAGIKWQKSTQSTGDNNSNCVEVGQLADGSGRVVVRHSHAPDGDLIVYTPQEWVAFIEGVKDGEFDF
ncbi:DUF397 domain-containing protein [Natronoglycomyces albus]|uniref:DUF397 domain-containing protein n=1 Tax=Natronoglycomyces albus TaxID=2811108 RepID=A0A895XN53_9ACTN|nr:DUF397 domain-containing protein [Natronoglycomyces albus]QSB04963.1 DUF397 domain-containing protein [Natronoglycomyces albus]